MDTDSARLVTDIAGLDRLKAKAREDQSGALDETSRQFESLLVNMMVKSMRQASLGDGILDSQQSLFYRDMYDQQLSVHLADKGIGLADVIKQQLGELNHAGAGDAKTLDDYRNTPMAVAAALAGFSREAAAQTDATSTRSNPIGNTTPVSGNTEPVLDSPRRFVETLWPKAQEAAAEMGIAPEALLAQAALETGWGRSVIHGSGGENSHNLFGIKADHRWDGERASVSTLEYVDGVAVRRKDPFRAYDSYGASFNDYVDFLRSGSRYQQALASTDDPRAYFNALQQAGYATDPAYADKVMRVLEGREMRTALERMDLAGSKPPNSPDQG